MKNSRIAVIGMGYVGLPLACAFGEFYKTIGYDINLSRIQQLNKNQDSTNEVSRKEFQKSRYVSFTNQLNDIAKCNIYIICVPTPINKRKKPDLNPLISATKDIGKVLTKNNIVIYESTVYPGATEEVCVPILALNSNLKFNKEFFCGYSPERINPGDKEHNIRNIIKVISGSNKATTTFVEKLYSKIVKVGVHRASSIKVAEAAKVIENIQRDINIALINELSTIFNSLKIDTNEVLAAAGTKWNFLNFKPGLVGGHCIGVDPYYLTYKAKKIGINPEVILSGRRTNERMVPYIMQKLDDSIKNNKKLNCRVKVLVMGLTFKENCPDFRNSKSLELVKKLSLKYQVSIHDPYLDSNLIDDKKIKYDKKLTKNNFYDAIIIVISHKEYLNMKYSSIKKMGKRKFVLMDLKSIFKKDQSNFRL